MSDKLVIIDGNSIFYRSFYALPLLSNAKGEYSNAVYGFAIQIINIINNIQPKYMVVAFDYSKHTFRNDMFDGYKATRKPMPDELRQQKEPLRKMLNLMGIAIAEKEGLEGDDIMGIIAKKYPDIETIIVTGDRDSFQLVDKTTSVYFTKKGTSDVKIMNLKTLKEEYGVTPKQFVDLKGLQGDTSDNIPGVAGIGSKTAMTLIQKYGSIEGIYKNIDSINGKIKERLLDGKEMAFLSKDLSRIITDGELDISIDNMLYRFPFSGKVKEFFDYYQFKTLLKNLDLFDSQKIINDENKFELIRCDTLEKVQNLVELIKTSAMFAIYLEKKSIFISFGKEEFVVDVSDDFLGIAIRDSEFFELIREYLESNNILKICLNSKQDMYYLKEYNITLNNYFDVSIAKYLIDSVSVDSIQDVFFIEENSFIASRLFKYYIEAKEKLEQDNLNYLFYEIENKLSEVLFNMEQAGFKIDRTVLDALKQKYTIEQSSIEEKVIELAGEKFNLKSPKQVADILFNKLKLSKNKKQKTNANFLQEIEFEHPIVSYILRYRKITKFLSTYIEGIYPHIDNEGFVHTYFKQTFTTTGRLSSIEPNLQNIPIRSEENKEIRSMFVASSKDSVLVDADYSQIELRLMAHMSKDEGLIDAFNKGVDIHTKTASAVFGVPDIDVTKEMRRMAKIVNFGILYGISDFGLSEDLKISTREAKALIENYYAKHDKVKLFMNNAIEQAKQTGVAKTLFGRTRKMHDINSSNFQIRARAERASQNMPLQGTAADIIKIAMVNTANALKKAGLKAKLIMQVHDELIVDCPIEEKEIVKTILKEQMESACKLLVPLVVDVVDSYRWSDGH